MILIQDKNNPFNDNETLVFTLPVKMADWHVWRSQCGESKPAQDGVSIAGLKLVEYIQGSVEDTGQDTMVLLPELDQTDESVLLAAARMRMVDKFTGRIYVVRGTHVPWTAAALQYAALGADPRLMLEVYLPRANP